MGWIGSDEQSANAGTQPPEAEEEDLPPEFGSVASTHPGGSFALSAARVAPSSTLAFGLTKVLKDESLSRSDGGLASPAAAFFALLLVLVVGTSSSPAIPLDALPPDMDPVLELEALLESPKTLSNLRL